MTSQWVVLAAIATPFALAGCARAYVDHVARRNARERIDYLRQEEINMEETDLLEHGKVSDTPKVY